VWWSRSRKGPGSGRGGSEDGLGEFSTALGPGFLDGKRGPLVFFYPRLSFGFRLEAADSMPGAAVVLDVDGVAKPLASVDNRVTLHAVSMARLDRGSMHAR
jgi:hypothetical protein